MQFNNEIECFDYLDQIGVRTLTNGERGCNGTFDQIMCFPATPINTTLLIQCPHMRGIFISHLFLNKTCLSTGEWEGFSKTYSHAGWTDYRPCLTESAREEYRLGQTESYSTLLRILSIIELVGISLSIVCIVVSLCIFASNRSLRSSSRIMIHLNLFVSILCQSLLRLGFYFDRLLFDESIISTKLFYPSRLIQLFSYVACPIAIALLEYFQSCNFIWMLCEGVYLNMLLVYSGRIKFLERVVKALYVVGWGFSILTVSIWFLSMYK
jgi:hypothetical protein